jgi:glycine/D-amino acid oxidase-like deaminating enzyme
VTRDFPDSARLQSLPEPVIVNCTGLGARTLFGDEELQPAKGQLEILVPQAELDYISLGPGPGMLYMIPRSDGVLLGGTFGLGDASPSPDPAETERILAGHMRINAALTPSFGLQPTARARQD